MVLLKYHWRQGLLFLCLLLFSSLSQSALRSGDRAHDFSTKLIADKPDLYLRSASFTLAEQCEPASPVMFVTVEIANLGKNPDLLRTRGNFVYAVNARMKHWGILVLGGMLMLLAGRLEGLPKPSQIRHLDRPGTYGGRIVIRLSNWRNLSRGLVG